MADQPLPGAGDVTIQLLGEPKPITLRCSAEAALRLCRQYGGLESRDPGVSTVITRVLGLDIDTMAEVIRAGVGIEPGKATSLEANIYKTGLYEVRNMLAPFLGALKNGGKPLAPEVDTISGSEGGLSDEENPPNL